MMGEVYDTNPYERICKTTGDAIITSMDDNLTPDITLPPVDATSRRDERYHRFYAVVDHVVEDILNLPDEQGLTKKRLKGDRLDRLRYSVETLIRDTVAIVLQRKRKGEAAIQLGQYAYGSSREDKNLTYDLHIKRAYEGMLRLGYIVQTKKGFYVRSQIGNGSIESKVTRYAATDMLIDLFTADEQKIFPVIVPIHSLQLIRVRTH